jgi:hypothetical protein
MEMHFKRRYGNIFATNEKLDMHIPVLYVHTLQYYPFLMLENSSLTSGINFQDVMTRLGVMDSQPTPFVMGSECVGTVTAVAEGVTSVKVRLVLKITLTMRYEYQYQSRDLILIVPFSLDIFPGR